MRIARLMPFLLSMGINGCASPSVETGVEDLKAIPESNQPPLTGVTAVKVASSDHLNQVKVKDESAGAACPPSDTVCPMNFAPVMCTASTYDGKALPEEGRIVVWGSNNCAGRLKMQKEACSRQWSPAKLGGIQCVPDATSGHCPPPAVECKPGGKSSTCVVSSFAGASLTDDQKISATAANECLARQELLQAACRNNLDPTQLGDIVCRSNKLSK
jgi:hypothetical protein